jgi:uncharacterized protein (DUF3820 family)
MATAAETPFKSVFDDCRYCGSTDLLTVLCVPPTPHYARTGCKSCGRNLGWEPAPMTVERARAFVMPFGKHAGKTLPEVPREYLGFLVREGIGREGTRRVVEFFLAHAQPDRGGAHR